MTVEKTHVVVTRYLPAEKPPLVHAYGPMTHARAKTVREELLAQHADKVADGTFSANVNKMLDIDEHAEQKVAPVPCGSANRSGAMQCELRRGHDPDATDALWHQGRAADGSRRVWREWLR